VLVKTLSKGGDARRSRKAGGEHRQTLEPHTQEGDEKSPHNSRALSSEENCKTADRELWINPRGSGGKGKRKSAVAVSSSMRPRPGGE